MGDTKAGPARGVLGLDQFVEWAFEHVVAKVGKVPAKDVGLYHVQDYSEAEYLDFIARAVNNDGSYERSSFYNFILNCFVEADEQCQGRITQDQFDKLLTRAASSLATSAWHLLRPAQHLQPDVCRDE